MEVAPGVGRGTSDRAGSWYLRRHDAKHSASNTNNTESHERLQLSKGCNARLFVRVWLPLVPWIVVFNGEHVACLQREYRVSVSRSCKRRQSTNHVGCCNNTENPHCSLPMNWRRRHSATGTRTCCFAAGIRATTRWPTCKSSKI